MKKKIIFVIAISVITLGAIVSSTNFSKAAMAADKVTRPLLQNSSGAYYCGCTCTTGCGAICK